jgi:hypothetical protein
MHGLAPDEQHLEVHDPDVGPDCAGGLGLVEHVSEGVHEPLFDLGHGRGEVKPDVGQRFDQPLVGGALGDHRGQEREQGLTRVVLGGQRLGVRHQLLDPVGRDGVEQRLLGGEVAVHGAGPDARPAGDLVDGDGQPLLGERLVRDVQHAGPVPGRVGAQLPRGLLTVQPRRSSFGKRGVRSV